MFMDLKGLYFTCFHRQEVSQCLDFHINLEWRQVENLPLNISENILENSSQTFISTVNLGLGPVLDT